VSGLLVQRVASILNLIRFAHNWNGGILEYWPPARRAYGSERKMGFGILEGWANGIIVLTIKLKMDNIL
jgi:hypothetical protein